MGPDHFPPKKMVRIDEDSMRIHLGKAIESHRFLGTTPSQGLKAPGINDKFIDSPDFTQTLAKN